MAKPIMRSLGFVLATIGAMAMATAWMAVGAEPVKLADAARFDLSADARAGSLDDGHVIEGNGSIARMSWAPQFEQPRAYTVSFPITHLRWRSMAVRFTPARDGTVTLTLMGPWEEASKGLIYRQEVLWDDVRASGAALDNGSFESTRDAAGPRWHNGGGTIERQKPDLTAVEGTHYARTWHNQTLFTTLGVAAGRPVTIRLSARAAPPVNFRGTTRITGQSTPAHQAARRFLRGANLGNGLEAPPGQDWGAHYTPNDLRHIRAQGFDHVRLPIGWHHYTGPVPEFRLGPEIFARADELIQAGLRQGLGVIINIHHFDDFTTNPQGQRVRFLAIWRQIAAHYARASEGLAFELLNEPKDAATTEVINPIFAEAIHHIRQIDPKRTIFLGPGRWNSVGELPRLHLPGDDRNLIVTVHNYEPFYFTHQGADWAGPDTTLTGIIFPGPPRRPLVPDPKLKLKRWVLDWVERYNTEPIASNPSSPRAFQGAIDQAKEWSDDSGRPIHFGEFGCYTRADPDSRAHYYRAFREAAERAGIGWAIWDWKAGFRYWDEKGGRPEPGMHEALFSRIPSR
jgi:endoglucanase